MKKFVSYYRVSTNKQSLGLDAQRSIVNSYLTSNSNYTLINEFCEKESGKINTRIELLKAIDECHYHNATLIIAKLDRLSRDVEFLFKLKNSGIEFIALDLPELNTLTLAIFAGLAQHERELISQRTKAALAELKKQGKQLGTPRNLSEYRKQAVENSVETRKNKALNNPRNKRAYAVIKNMREQNSKWVKIAEYLNENGFVTSTGKTFQIQTVKNIYNMFQCNIIRKNTLLK